MTNLIIIVVALLILFALAVILKAKLGEGGAADDYYLRKSLLTAAERSFLGVLEPVLPAGVRVFAKVRLEDIVGVKKGLDRAGRASARNRIKSRHVDFLLVRTTDLAPVAGIELDDSSHEEESRQERDAFVDGVFASAGLPLLHIPAQKSYNPAELRIKLAELPKTERS